MQASNGQYNSRYTMAAIGGNGVCVRHRASEGGIYDLPENTDISVAIWLGPNEGYKGSEHVYYNDN